MHELSISQGSFDTGAGLEYNLEYFPTLRAYDEAQYLLRQRQQILDYPSIEGKPYRGCFLLHEILVSVNGRCQAVCLSMAATHIYAQLCDSSSALLKQHIPYCYIPGPEHGKMEGRRQCWDMRVSASGHEAIVEELQRRIWTYELQRLDVLLTRWDTKLASCAYFIERMSPEAPSETHIVLSDRSALDRVRVKNLIEDCHSIRAPSDALDEEVAQEKALLAKFICAQHTGLTRTPDTKVILYGSQLCVAKRND